MRNPANADYRCPFINGTCIKFSRTLGEPAPVCSVYRHAKKAGGSPQNHPPVCTCPNRFYAADIASDVIRECWIGAKPANPKIVHEVGMQKFGKVDMVVADVDEATEKVMKFLPVELQAVDITGSVLPYYEALVGSQMVEPAKSYNFNWANVRKRFLSQLVAKGFYCHHWGTRIVAVVQTDLFDQFHAHAKITEVQLADSNIIFMLYQFKRVEAGGPWVFEFQRLAPTTHMNVMNAVLYETPPVKAAFEAKIIRRIYG
jgi:hypothetical protein